MRRISTFCAGLICLAMLALAGVRCEARLEFPGDSLQIDNANLVVIVAPVSGQNFRVERVEWDDNTIKTRVGDTLILPPFELGRLRLFRPDSIKPFTPDTRILLYLRRDAKTNRLSIAQAGRAFFWVEKSEQIGRLIRQAQRLVAAQREWKSALAAPRGVRRVAAIYPFLAKYEWRFNLRARRELTKMGALSGDYLAPRLATLHSTTRRTILDDISGIRSPKLHRALLLHLAQQQKRYENHLAASGPNEKKRIDAWNNLPPVTRSVRAELWSGLRALTAFKARRDLPFIRHVARWSVKYRFRDNADVALDAFYLMPDRANVAVVGALWKEFSTHKFPAYALSPFKVKHTLASHRFPETVTVLAPFLHHKNRDLVQQTRALLVRLVGRDVGSEPRAWIRAAKQVH